MSRTEKLICAPIPQQVIERTPEIFFTLIAVRNSEAHATVPSGYRMARPDEIVLNWLQKPEFRKALGSCSIWADQIGLDSSGRHIIDENGIFTGASKKIHKMHEEETRSEHYPGKLLLNLYGGFGRLALSANYSSDRIAFVACVALEGTQTNHHSVLHSGLRSLVRPDVQSIIV